MSERADLDFIGDIQEALGRIKTYTDEMTYELPALESQIEAILLQDRGGE